MGILSGLRSDPAGTLIILLYQIPAVLIALTLHELSHGYVAYRCGDPTARMMGRLSFNPLKHLDPVGTAFMFLFGFGWARPVPVNPRKYKHFKRDDILVSLAGVTMNFFLFFLATLCMIGVNEWMWSPELWRLNQGPLDLYPLLTRKNFLSFDGLNFLSVMADQKVLFVKNAANGAGYVLDSASFDAFSYYLRTPWLLYVQRFLMFFARVNLSLCIFNLLPIPPLDGYHVVNDIFLRGKLHVPARVVNLLMMGLLALFYFTDVPSRVMGAAISFVQNGVLSGILAVFGLR